MFVIDTRNVNSALSEGIHLITTLGEPIESRVGTTLEVPEPVTTVYRRPWERVLLSSTRDANPFFHLMESMWILAGRKDVGFLTEFNKRMVDYSDDGKVFNAPYGHRIREGIQTEFKDTHNQLQQVITILYKDPNSRQAIIQIWDDKDLMRVTKDKACNMSIVFSLRNNNLNMTVYNRSNDMIWGAYGANAVQFSIIQEYVAACLNVNIGTYTQVSNSYHVYLDGPGGVVWNKISKHYTSGANLYDSIIKNKVIMCNEDILRIDYDLATFFTAYDLFGIEELGEMRCWESDYFNELIMPMLCLYLIYKHNGSKEALKYIKSVKADDWSLGCAYWLHNRKDK